MRDLTVKQALAEAVRRWGKAGAVERDPRLCRLYRIPEKYAGRCTSFFNHPEGCQGGKPTCKVGRLMMGMFFSIEGDGYTFREAFAEVDRKLAIDRAKYCRRQKQHREDGICGMCHYQGPPGQEGFAKVEGKVLSLDRTKLARHEAYMASRKAVS
jgi:hypothetical protein